MSGYTKLFSSIVTSSIWSEDHGTRVVWITLLAMADKDGFVDASIPGLAKVAGVEIGELEKSLQVLMDPDPYSRTSAHEGRRIEAVEGGWRLLNHGKYRAKMDREEQREKARIRQQRHRDKGEEDVTERDSHAASRPVTPCHAESRMSRQAEAKAEAKAKAVVEEGAGAQGRRQQRPSAEIPTMDEAKTFAEMGAGIPEEVVVKWWESREKIGWIWRGSEIRNWRQDLTSFHKEWKGREGKEAHLKASERPSEALEGLRSRLRSMAVLAVRQEGGRQIFSEADLQEKYDASMAEFKALGGKVIGGHVQ